MIWPERLFGGMLTHKGTQQVKTCASLSSPGSKPGVLRFYDVLIGTRKRG
jgi:hypothetical protein